MIRINTDGGARGNPGPAGVGVVVRDGDAILEEFSAYIGTATNNQAEYAALLAGLGRAQKYTDLDVECLLDSELVVRQLKGEYKIKSPKLRKLAHQTHGHARAFRKVTYRHVPRAENAHADRLVNQALDARSEQGIDETLRSLLD